MKKPVQEFKRENEIYMEKEQKINLERCKRLNYYGRSIFQTNNYTFKMPKSALIFVRKYIAAILWPVKISAALF